ncbi:hypothetical protein [Streptomyces sp. NPDC058451]|uniref:hypothetical protein n=1 Tax=Streptomyces sp. NPDC058451 TaxID=3346506 RepID=UPI003667B41A
MFLPRPHPWRNQVWETDHMQVPVLVEVDGTARRPWITWFTDCPTNVITGIAVTPGDPSRESVLAGLRSAVLREEPYGPFGGLPEKVRVDRGKDFLSRTVTAAFDLLDVTVEDLPAYTPHLKGTVEGLNRAVESMFLASLPGYARQPRPGKYPSRPKDEVLLSFEDFTARLLDWTRWWNTEHQPVPLRGRTPLEAWQADPTPLRDMPATDLWTFTLEDASRWCLRQWRDAQPGRARRTACAVERSSTRVVRGRYYAPHVTIPVPSPTDVDAAKALASREGRPANEHSTGVTELAAALGVLRRTEAGQGVTDAELLAAHDLLYAQVPRHLGDSSMRRLAEILVGRGVVPKPGDYEGQWWLWWPKNGYGPCRDCRKPRSLTRYSGRLGHEYRYLCARCRSTERQQIAEQADRLREMLAPQATLHPAPVPAPAASSHLTDAAPADSAATAVPRPSDRDWETYVTRLEELLGALAWAGFDLPQEWDSDFDEQEGALLFATLRRGDGAVDVAYHPHQGLLVLQPFDDVTGEWPESYSLLEDSIEIPVAICEEQAVTAVEAAAGDAGLLDAAHVRVADTAPPEAVQEFALRRVRWIFQPAADYRELPLAALLREVTENEWLSAYLDWVVGMAGRDVAPDIVPDAAALGVAAWCWRNNTAVEDHHLDTDVLMARVNIAVTRITQQHICPVEGIDWDSIKDALMNPQWALADGTPVHSLFGPGWTEVAATVIAELDRWRRLDHEVLGPEATLILMSIGGSTSYTDSWWGQGRWRSICRRIIDDATAAGLSLPPPYGQSGPDVLLADLDAPDQVPDTVLDWLIDPPEADHEGPRGLRMNGVTRPPQHCWDPYWLTDPNP